MAENQIIKQSISKEIQSENKAEEFDMGEEMKVKSGSVSIKKKAGNPNWKKGVSGNLKGRPKESIFSLRDDLIASLRRIKKNNPQKYQEIIDSYWEEPKWRQFLLEIVDGKARQSTEIGGMKQNPIRVIEVRPMEEKGKNQ